MIHLFHIASILVSSMGMLIFSSLEEAIGQADQSTMLLDISIRDDLLSFVISGRTFVSCIGVRVFSFLEGSGLYVR